MSAIAFKFPKDGWQTILLIALFLYVDSAKVGTVGARIRELVGGHRVMDIIRKLVVYVHIAEALAMFAVNVKRNAPLGTALKWSLTTLVVGYPSWITFGRMSHITDLQA
ncbi:hypothetical protein MYAM1_000104 [Malassezia yamatoensis]|uniref:Uncharacterized protein n=1 Tax=Malassezia yamatoensis TaxID=253288 RepID=A0AAJ6CG87_9BASI|nr:hypothetical protein MYAM1_000104 [Malassezia yamatoensis]